MVTASDVYHCCDRVRAQLKAISADMVRPMLDRYELFIENSKKLRDCNAQICGVINVTASAIVDFRQEFIVEFDNGEVVTKTIQIIKTPDEDIRYHDYNGMYVMRIDQDKRLEFERAELLWDAIKTHVDFLCDSHKKSLGITEEILDEQSRARNRREIKEESTPEEMRTEIFRLSRSNGLVAACMDRANHLGMSSEDRYTLLAYTALKQSIAAQEAEYQRLTRSPAPYMFGNIPA